VGKYTTVFIFDTHYSKKNKNNFLTYKNTNFINVFVFFICDKSKS
jgi:hypothetical protein